MKLRSYFLTVVVVLMGAFPGGLRAQPGSQPYVFYGEEPWGGSYLGVDTRDVTQDRLGPLQLKEERGVEVTMVDQDAPAGKAGLKEHDVILSVNDQQVQSVEQLRRLIREIPSGRTVTIGISRDGQLQTLKATLAERSKMPGMDKSFNFTVPPINIPAVRIPPINMPEMDMPSIDVIYSPRRSGLMVENLTSQLGEFFGVKSGKGVLVRSVEKGSRGEQAGFRAGDVIVKVDGSTVTDCSDFTRLLRERKEEKTSVTVLRERKEQNLTLTLPPPRHSGSIGCADIEQEACAKILSEREKIAALMPELNTADIKRIQSDVQAAGKELQEEMLKHRDDLNKDMQKLQEELRQEQEEMKQEMKKWAGQAEI